MHRWATKDTYEREEDEAERLVRPAPKVKPPRKDKRRETTQAERDPDTAGDPDLKGDRDLSLNYKNVGGSLQRRVADRYLQALAGKPPPLIPVWDEQEQKRTSVPESRIKSNPSRYKRVQPGEAPAGKDDEGKPSAPSAAPEAPAPPQAPKPEAPKPEAPQPGVPQPGAPKPEGAAPKPGGEPAKPDPKREAARAKLNQSFENEQARDAFIEKLPFAERGADGQLRVYDKSQKKSVPVGELSSAALEDLVERRRVEKLGDDTVAAFREHSENAEIQAALKDLAFLGGATKGPGDEEGPLATRLRALQKEGHPLESLPLSKHIPELKGVKLPEDIQSVDDLIKATKKLHPKPENKPGAKPESKPGAKPESKPGDSESKAQAQRVVERFLQEGRAKSDEFRAYAKGLPTTTEDAAGEPLFLDRSKKPKKRVPFDELPDDAKAKVIEEFEGKEQKKVRREQMQVLVRQHPNVQSIFDQIAAVMAGGEGATGDVAQRFQELKKSGAPLDELPISKHLPELKGVKLPEGVESLADLAEASKEVALPPLKRRKVPSDERQQIDFDLLATIPAVHYGQISKLHPDDQAAILNDIKTFRSTKPEDMDAFRDRLQAVYQTDPAKIPPPETVEWKGKQVSFADLEPKDKAQALNDHRNRILAISLAGQGMVAKDMSKNGVPAGLSDRLVAMWGKPAPPPRQTYEEVLGDGKVESPMDSAATKKLLDGLKTDDAKAQAVAYLQARDYQDMRRRYLEAPTDSDTAINEHVPTGKLLKNLERASKDLRSRDALYPEEGRVNSAKLLRERLRQSFKDAPVSADKRAAVERWMQEQDADDYDAEYKRWQKETKQYESDRKKAERGRGPYRDGPLPDPPREPLKPLGYDEVRRPKPSRGNRLMDFFRSLGGKPTPPVVTARVLDRYLTCTAGDVMASEHDLRSRQAVYWGVEPYPPGHEGFAPYNEWEQAHARDLDAADETALLKAARDWLGQFVLDPSVMGDGVPDARFRAALDYAVYTLDNGKYSVGLHPALYNKLLARLTGQPEDETLLTVRKAARGSSESPYHPTPERTTTMHASARIRSYAAKLASTQPHIAFDLMKLAAEQDEAEQGQQDQGQQAQGQKKQGGQLPPALKEHMKKKEEKSDDDKEQGQKKQAYAALRHEVIRVASENPQARMALQPVLRLIKQIG